MNPSVFFLSKFTKFDFSKNNTLYNSSTERGYIYIYITIAFIRKTIFFMVDLSHAIFINHEYAIVLDHLLLSAKFLHYLAVD